MKIEELANKLCVKTKPNIHKLNIYNDIRNCFIKRSHQLDAEKFQSPSINLTTHVQRNFAQNEEEHSVYQRADYIPIKTERKFNRMFRTINNVEPKTLFFNSGMASISTIMFYLKNSKRLGTLNLGENVYFETKWLAEDFTDIKYFNEYNLNLDANAQIFWWEYPINCTQPTKFPFEQQLDIEKIFNIIKQFCDYRPKKNHFLVIDYTLYYLPFQISDYLLRVPDNLEIFLITSLQKHRGYGLDLTNGGAITFYSKNNKVYEKLVKLRAIMGTSIPQETIWTMPEIETGAINKLVKDSGKNAQKIYEFISKYNIEKVKFYFSNNEKFLTSFIFIEIDKELVSGYKKKPYLSDILIEKIVFSAIKNGAILVYGTSFGLPFTRIFKNSERYDNTNSLRLAVGYDREMNKNVDKSIIEGVKLFQESIRTL